MESFGARLRRRREEQDIALATIAEQTKIKSSLFDALERDDLSHWPSGFFRRAVIRAYADAIGLDPDVVVREFLEAHPEPVEVVVPAAAGPAPTRFRAMVDSAMASLFPRRRPPVIAAVAVTTPEPPTPARSTAPAPPEPDVQAVAHLCTQLARVQNAGDAQALLGDAARILDAVGIIVWTWHAPAAELRPGLAHGYSTRVLAQIPAVKRDDANATAAAFRSGQPCAISASGRGRGALVLPLVTAAGCAGVLAIELPHEQTASVLAVATIMAAQLAQCLAAHPLEPVALNDNEATPWPLMSPHFVSAKAAQPT
jgi:transcriptional regulator with XRE-family HTH domain